MASNDDVVLRDQIRALKAQQLSIKEEKMKHEKSIQSSEMKCNALKMEANILMALDEVRFQEIEDSVASHSIHEDGLFNRQFIERNLKLELQILNAELRQALPKLEREAIRAEDGSNTVKEELQDTQKKMDTLPIQSEQQLVHKEEELMNKKQLLHEQIGKQHKEALKERSANLRFLTQLRAKVKTIDDDLSFEKDRAQRIKHILLEEQAKVEFLKLQLPQLLKQLQPYHNGKGWQTEAFIANTSSIHGTVHISQLPSILSLWLIGSEFHPNHDDHDTRGEGITAEVIEDTLRDLVGTGANGRPLADAEELTCSEFVTLCDALCAR